MMNYLGNKQLKLMKRLLKKNLKKSELSEKEWISMSFLLSQNLVKQSIIIEDKPESDENDSMFSLTELGIAVQNTYAREKFRWLIPVIASLIAIGISIVALGQSSDPEVNVYNRNFITNTNTDKINAIYEQ